MLFPGDFTFAQSSLSEIRLYLHDVSKGILETVQSHVKMRAAVMVLVSQHLLVI